MRLKRPRILSDLRSAQVGDPIARANDCAPSVKSSPLSRHVHNGDASKRPALRSGMRLEHGGHFAAIVAGGFL